MASVPKLIPIAEYKKPLFNPQGDDIWILERLEAAKKEAARKLSEKTEELYDQLHMPGLSDADAQKIANTLKATKISKESKNVRKLNELLRMQKAQAYEAQLAHAGN